MGSSGFWWQNLNENPGGSGLRHGRCWFRCWRTVKIEWAFGEFNLGASLTFFRGDRGDELWFAVQLPLASLFVGISGVFRPRRHGSDRRISIGVFSGMITWTIWRPTFASWDRSVPRWREGSVYLPWSWEHVRHVWLNPDGSFYRAPEPGEYRAPSDITSSHPYSYVLKNGQRQDVTATIYGEEREWRWKWFTWLPWPRRIQRSIDIRFSREVGERAGSWKGGCLGCGFEWRPGETQENALRRMEDTRKF